MAQSGHVTAIGILEIIWGATVVLGGLFLAIAGGTASAFIGKQFAEFGGEFWGTAGAILFVMIGLVAVAIGSTGIIAGSGLLRYQNWGRIFSLVLATIAGLMALASLIDLDLEGVIIPGAYSAYAWIMLTRPHIVALFQSGGQQQQVVVVT